MQSSTPSFLVGRPQFMIQGRTRPHNAGTCFLLRADDTVLLTTCLHCLGRAGGFGQQMPAEDVPSRIASASMLDIDGGKVLFTAEKACLGKILQMTDDEDSNDTTGDIVTFEVPGEKAALHALPLATVEPQVGDEVWVYGKELGKNKPAGHQVFRGTISSLTDPTFTLVNLDQYVYLTCWSGAPVLNSSRTAIVGMLCGGDDDARWINVTPLRLMREWVNSAMTKRAAAHAK